MSCKQKIYVDQDYTLRLKLDECGIYNLQPGDVVNAVISILKPDGTTFSVNGTVDGVDIVYEMTSAQNDQPKIWTFQPDVEMSSGKVIPGKAVRVYVHERFC